MSVITTAKPSAPPTFTDALIERQAARRRGGREHRRAGEEHAPPADQIAAPSGQ